MFVRTKRFALVATVCVALLQVAVSPFAIADEDEEIVGPYPEHVWEYVPDSNGVAYGTPGTDDIVLSLSCVDGQISIRMPLDNEPTHKEELPSSISIDFEAPKRTTKIGLSPIEIYDEDNALQAWSGEFKIDSDDVFLEALKGQGDFEVGAGFRYRIGLNGGARIPIEKLQRACPPRPRLQVAERGSARLSEIAQELLLAPNVNRIFNEAEFRPNEDPQWKIDFEALYRSVARECQVPGGEYGLRDILHRATLNHPLGRSVYFSTEGARHPIRLGFKDYVILHVWRLTATCSNLKRADAAYREFVSGRMSTADASKVFADETLQLSILFNEHVANELMMAKTFFYTDTIKQRPFNFPSLISIIPMQGDLRVDTSSAIAWAILAHLNGSHMAASIAESEILPRANWDQIQYAKKLVISYANMRVQWLERSRKLQADREKLAHQAIPQIDRRSLIGMSRSDAIKFVDRQAGLAYSTLSRIAQSPFGYKSKSELCNGPRIRDVRGPDNLALPIIEEGLRKCLAEFDSAVAQHGQQLRDSLLQPNVL